MGLYDRNYTRAGSTPWDRAQTPPRSMTTTLIIINVVAFVVTLLSRDIGRTVLEWLAIVPGTLSRPWMWYRFLTYGFLHSPINVMHVAFNMFGLFIFGRIIERRLGRTEFLAFYLAAVVVSGILGAALSVLLGQGGAAVIGASGAVVALAILFAFFYPNQTILVMFILPMPAWVAAIAFVAIDLFGAINAATGANLISTRTAYTVHLAGAAFGAVYYLQKISFTRLIPGLTPGGYQDGYGGGAYPGGGSHSEGDGESVWSKLKSSLRDRSRRAKLKVHDPDRKLQRDEAEADRILEKIHREGEASLTASERRTLERYSRTKRQSRDG